MTAPEKTPQAGRPKGVPDHNQRNHLTNDSHRGKAQGKSQLDAIAAAIAGQRAGAEIVRALRDGIAAPDALLDRLREIDDAATLRAFCRVIQKTLEQGNELPALQRGPR